MENNARKKSKKIVYASTALFLFAGVIFFSYAYQNDQSFAEQTDDDIVRSFFPQKLLDMSVNDFNNGGPRPFQTYDFVVADLNNDGASHFIIAAYSNGFSGIVRLLKKEGGVSLLIDEPDIPTMGGDFPGVELIDLNNDLVPEIIVSFASGSGPTENWVFKWYDNKLNLISPTREGTFGVIHTVLSDAAFVDLDGDGIKEIINPLGSGPVSPDEIMPIGGIGKIAIFKFDGTRYLLVEETNFKIVLIDIKPGSDPNCFNNNDRGVIPVVILSNVDFDATTIDPTTVSLDGQAVRIVGNGKIQASQEDANRDGRMDLVVQIEDIDGIYTKGTTIATLTAKTAEGVSIQGTDSICITQ